ncbi:MAG: sodium:solute symporter family protein [Thermoanaerobaculia bacterium]
MTTIDLVIVLSYVVGLFVFGMVVGLRETAEDFLILSRRANVILVLFSVVSSWVGVGVIVGTAAAGYDSGISFALTGGLGALVAVGAASVIAPRIKAFGDLHRAHTLGDFFGIRYSRAARVASASVVILIYLLFTAVQFNGLARLLNVWTGVAFESAIAITAVTTIIYTAFAGIKSDFYTDVIHFCVMAVVLLGVLLPILGGATHGFRDLLALPPSFFSPFSFGGVGYFAGALVFGVGVVFVSMELWQRIYASTSAATARKALIGSALAVVPFYAVAAVSGMALRVRDPFLTDRDLALFVMMKTYLPNGILGLGVAAFIAVFVSSVNTMIMVVSATFTKDFYKTMIKPEATEMNMLRMGRISTLLAGIGGLLLSYVVRDIITLSILALFLLLVFLPAVIGGFYWRRSTATGAFWSIVAGLVGTFGALPYLKTNAFVPGFLLCTLVFVVVSKLTPHAPSEIVEVLNEVRR